MNSYYFDSFIIPFWIGVISLFGVMVWKWGRWLWQLPIGDKEKVWRGIFSRATFGALWEAISEALLHRKIFKVNPRLGYMHMSLAFGWFLLIAVGWVEASIVLGGAPLHAHVFFRFFDPAAAGEGNHLFTHLMDALLLLVLSGVTLAWFKRLRSKALGMRRTTRHLPFDKIALSALWFIFPLRLLAESLTAAIKGNGGFLTGTIGDLAASIMSPDLLAGANSVAWWCYSFALGTFFVAMPFSRYMHIFTEVPLIFLRRYGVRSGEKPSSFDNFQIQACSRCGICIDPCQLQSQAGIDNVQSVYFLRDRRYGKLSNAVADNCLMCGRCAHICPVGIDLNTLRLGSRIAQRNISAEDRYDYLEGEDTSSGSGRVGYFAGCMTLLTPSVLQSMEQIFAASGEEVWWADRDGGTCCGRPMKLSGEVESARRMMEFNTQLFRKHQITTLVTSCPICLKVFRDEYNLPGIKVMHHTEYILSLAQQGRITLHNTGDTYTYHDPCELGRGSGIYEPPRELLSSLGVLCEPEHTRENALCCGSSVANLAIADEGQRQIGEAVARELAATGASVVVTACPLCKKAIARADTIAVVDIAQVVASNLASQRAHTTPTTGEKSTKERAA